LPSLFVNVSKVDTKKKTKFGKLFQVS